MRIFSLLCVFLFVPPVWANMASPVLEEPWTATPFVSKHVEIVREKILVTPDARFETARFQIEYHIRSGKSGKQIPLLFYASDFKENFQVWVDGTAVQLQPVPERYATLEGTPFEDFDYFFETENWSDAQQVLIDDSPTSGFYVTVDDLKFFETTISEGTHVIRVEYVAKRWTDLSGWVQAYHFRYALSPAKHWKSFGQLDITLDASSFDGKVTTSLGDPDEGDLQSVATWHFSSLPAEVLQISYQREINWAARALIFADPLGLTAVFALILVVLHFRVLKKYRNRYPQKRFSRPMIVGSIVVPFLILLFYVWSFDLIDAVIGPEASGFHGYTFLAMLFYPVFLPFYWVFMWLTDRVMKRNLNPEAMVEQS